jgi:hypothetical protein
MQLKTIGTVLTPEELRKATNYVRDGGAKVTEHRAREIAKAYGMRTPSLGHERLLEFTEHQNAYLMNEAGTYTVRVWTSPNAPWLRSAA